MEFDDIDDKLIPVNIIALNVINITIVHVAIIYIMQTKLVKHKQ